MQATLSLIESHFGMPGITASGNTPDRSSPEALCGSEERCHNLFASIDEGFCIIEMSFDESLRPVDFTFVEVNPSFEMQTGILDASGKRMRDIYPALEDFWFEAYGAVALTGVPVRFVHEAKTLNRWFDVYAFRPSEFDNRRVALLFTNITERKIAEEALRRAQKQLANRADQLEQIVAERTSELTRTNRQLETLIYSIAHYLRAPLRSMQGFSEMLIEEAGPGLTVQARDYAQRISASAQMMDTMLRDLISFSGISEQRIELVSVNMRDVLTLVLASLEKEIQQSNASVELIGQWPNVLGHEPTLGPILVHLLANAIRFVAPDVRPVVRLSVELHGEFVRLSVEDNGIGIDSAHQEQIYTLFTQLHGGKYGGTGAGLAMVKKGIERMGGEVGVQSSLGHGSRFWISLRRSHV